ncbi:DEAD/DEAH box helicase [Metabacillus sp. KIGAM252]|uniref:DEAD-box ATP-dependent RNA helicase CshB n=1 Tax=Metabacillus flavus TaxID=2823519 RepID=A0ABS5LGK4_9BACI|nr:DEAD/DEAH box helicase [Metabacillus flavus]MBS2969719.1 DEAD/DEAH box helicase [Metabacillus flavus]
MERFERLKLKPFLIDAVKELGFDKPTEIQERIIPSIIKGESVIGQSQTGTGKTHAYLLPLLNNLDPASQSVQVVITSPTRELANQIYKEVLKLISHHDQDIQARCFTGGTDKQRSIDKLKQQPQIVIGTPGRLHDLLKVNALHVNNTKSFVVDEADMILDMGFLEDVDRIASGMPEQLQMLVFSATIPEKLKPFLKKYMANPKFTHVAPKQAAAEKIEHVLLPLRHRNKTKLVHDMLLAYNPYLAIVFTNTKKMADAVADELAAKGLKVGRIHGGLPPRERKKVMKQVNDLEYQYVVATDLAARGIDIEGVSHIINYELPQDLDFYIHRVGRTARAGYSGLAVTIYETSDEDALAKLEKMGISFAYKDLEGTEFKDADDRHRRKNRPKTDRETDERAKHGIRKPKKVKPGYKRHMKWEMDKIKKKQRRIKRREK